MSKISLNYARALITAADNDAKKVASFAEELSVIVEALSKAEAQNFCASLNVNEREKLIEDLFGKSVDKLLVNFLKLIATNGRMPLLAEINRDFQTLANALNGKTEASLESPVKLSDALVKQIVEALEKMSGKEVTLATNIDPALLGGVKIKMDGDIIDLSLAGKLQKLRRALV